MTVSRIYDFYSFYFSPTTGPAWLSKNQAPIVLRKRREHVKSTANWPLFYYHFSKDHSKSNLIWNYKTREELRESLENEIALFKQVCRKNLLRLSQLNVHISGQRIGWQVHDILEPCRVQS